MTRTLCVFIDAFGWELLQRHAFLDGLARSRGKVETVLGYSCTCDPTILTGKLPREHGHFSFFAWDPQRSPFPKAACRALGMLPPALLDRARVRSVLSRAFGRRLGYTGYFNLYALPFARLHEFDYTEKRDLYAPGGINNGCPTLFDDLRDAGIPHFVSDWRRGDAENVEACRAALIAQKPKLAYLYLAGMDAVLHADGTRSERVAEKIAWYDRALRSLYDAAGSDGAEVRMHVFSDHGMTDVVRTCNLMARIDALGLTWGKDYAAVYDSTMARFWLLSDRAKTAIPDALAQEPLGRTLSDADLHRYGCDFADRRYGHLFFLLEPGVLLCPSFMGARPIAGMHGYAPEHPDSAAVFVSTATDLELPTRLTDLHGLMRADAGLAPSHARRAA